MNCLYTVDQEHIARVHDGQQQSDFLDRYKTLKKTPKGELLLMQTNLGVIANLMKDADLVRCNTIVL